MSRGGVRRGFTLIELLIVIAIIGILAGVVLISIGGQTDSAKDAVRQSIARQLIVVANTHAAGNNSSYSGICNTNSSPFTSGDGERLIQSLLGTTGDITPSSGYTSGLRIPSNIPGGAHALCLHKGLHTITHNAFALYWPIDENRVGCFNTYGTVNLNIDRAGVGFNYTLVNGIFWVVGIRPSLYSNPKILCE